MGLLHLVRRLGLPPGRQAPDQLLLAVGALQLPERHLHARARSSTRRATPSAFRTTTTTTTRSGPTAASATSTSWTARATTTASRSSCWIGSRRRSSRAAAGPSP
ncbi:MAG: hypothetical protein MZW92_68665 [Comamonadaceae bacterium]|nr:hypothetical protein [Comamonadaceae bacterium]